MPRKLGDDDETVKVEIKMPGTLKGEAVHAAQREGDGDLSSWVRGLIRNAIPYWKFARKDLERLIQRAGDEDEDVLRVRELLRRGGDPVVALPTRAESVFRLAARVRVTLTPVGARPVTSTRRHNASRKPTLV